LATAGTDEKASTQEIKSTHTKIIVQRVFPNSDARELKEDVDKKLG